MSTNLNYKQVANVKRRTWDVEAYEQKARERVAAEEAAAAASGQQQQQQPFKKKQQTYGQQHGTNDDEAAAARKRIKLTDDDDDNKEEFMPAEPGAAGPQGSERAFLKPRRGKVDINSKIGTTEMISVEAATKTSLLGGKDSSNTDAANNNKDGGVTKTGVGWHCRVCDCFLKDSMTYLSHINGRKHQRKLGFSMRVERSSKDQMLSRLSQLTQEKERNEKKSDTATALLLQNNETHYQDVVQQKDEELAQKKLEKARRRKEKKEKKRLGLMGSAMSSNNDAQSDDNNNEEGGEALEEQEEEEEEEDVNPDMAAMMGFSGFGGSAK